MPVSARETANVIAAHISFHAGSRATPVPFDAAAPVAPASQAQAAGAGPVPLVAPLPVAADAAVPSALGRHGSSVVHAAVESTVGAAASSSGGAAAAHAPQHTASVDNVGVPSDGSAAAAAAAALPPVGEVVATSAPILGAARDTGADDVAVNRGRLRPRGQKKPSWRHRAEAAMEGMAATLELRCGAVDVSLC